MSTCTKIVPCTNCLRQIALEQIVGRRGFRRIDIIENMNGDIEEKLDGCIKNGREV